MNNTTAYTPLESLFLFQSLYAWGTESTTFSRISEALKNHELINQAPTYDPGRLSSDALRELYKQRVREEGGEEDREDGGSPVPSKLRKLQNPASPSTEDGNGLTEKLARLVDRSYAWYTKSIIRDIREDERRYGLLEREIQEIESRESEKLARDESVENGRQGSAPVEGEIVVPVSSGEHVQPERFVEDVAQDLNRQESVQTKEIRRKPSDPSPVLPSPSSRSDGFAISDLVNGPTPSRPSSRPTSREPISHSRNGSQSSHNAYPYSTGASRPSPLQTVPPPGMIGSQGYNSWNHQPGPPPLQNYQHGPSYSPQYPPPFSPSLHSQRGSFSGPPGMLSHHTPMPSSPLTASGRSNSIQLPPLIPQPPRSSASPARSLDTLADLAGQQNHIPAVPHHQQHQQGMQTYGAYGGHQFNGYNLDSRPQSGSGHPTPAYNHQIPAINTQPHLPPPTFPPQHSPAAYSYPPRPVENPLAVGPQQYNSPYNGPQNGPAPASSIPNHLSRLASISTPMRTPLDSRFSLSNLPQTPAFSTPPNRPMNSTGKIGTRWKPLETLPQELTPKFRGPRSPKRPSVEPLSPILPKAQLPVTTPAAPNEVAESATTPAKKETDKLKASDHPKRGTQRAGGTASPVIADSNSQSEISQADELSPDNVFPSQQVKQEVATPRAPTEEDAEAPGEITADKSQPRPSSRHRGMARDEAEPPSRQSTKRKRVDSPIPSPRKPTGSATHVIWTRNFQKICAPALAQIGEHRYASNLKDPIKDDKAPQYSSLIKYPQNLVSINKAINAGRKAATSAAKAAGIDPKQMEVKLPISDELVPPRGIINNQQLEKELAHMFANAVMYNYSPKGFKPEFQKQVAAAKAGEEGDERAARAEYGFEVAEYSHFNQAVAMSEDVFEIFNRLRAAERPRGGEVEGDGGVGSQVKVVVAGDSGGEVVGKVAAVDDEEEDELAGEGDHSVAMGSGSVPAKRRKRA